MLKEYKEKLLFPKDLYILTFTDPLTKNVIAVKNFADNFRASNTRSRRRDDLESDRASESGLRYEDDSYLM